MQNFFRFMIQASRYLGDTAFRHSLLKRVLLVFMVTASFSRAIKWDNEATINAVCDNSTMHLRVNFSSVFQGTVYQTKGFFNPKCSYTVPINQNVKEVYIPMSFGSCDIKVEKFGNKTIASTEVVIQMHSLLDSVYDKTVDVSCDMYNFQVVNQTNGGDSFVPGMSDHSWIEFKNGLVLFGEVGEPIESSLYLVVNVVDDGSSRDMVVQNCIAHTDKNVTNRTNLARLSNFYGCPDASAVLPNFTVVRPENSHVSMFAYAPVTNFGLIASRGRMSVTCGITICEKVCPARCNDTSPVRLPLSDYTTKDMVTRNDGVEMPDSLRELNRHNDRSRRTINRPIRSLPSILASIFRWESRIVNGSVTEGNVTDITSIGMTKGLVVKSGLFEKDVLVPAFNPVGVNLKNTGSDLERDEFVMDGSTFRFIVLMTICMFITVVACFCCYSDKSQKTTRGQSPFVF